MADGNLVYANQDTTVHVTQGTVSSQFGEFEVVEGHSLAAGETISLDQLPKYQQEAIKEGKVASVELVSEKEAQNRAENIQKVKALLGQVPGGVDVPFQAQQILGDDG